MIRSVLQGTLCFAIIVGCQTTKKHQTSETLSAKAHTLTKAHQENEHRTESPLLVLEERQFLMGMNFSIKVLSEASSDTVRNDLRSAFLSIRQTEFKMSEWLPTSEVSQINRAAGKSLVPVSKDTFEVIKFAKALARRSDGAFDPTWAAFRDVWQFKAPPFAVPSQARINNALALVDYRDVKVSASHREIGLAKPGMQLGLGAIAKGFGIDAAATVLRAKGYENFIIDGGGDIYLAGQNRHQKPWRVGVKHPRRAETYLGFVNPKNRAIVTSGDYEHYFEVAGRRYHHILDVRTGRPARRAVAVTVMAPRAVQADAIATAAFVLGPVKGIELAKKYEHVSVLVLDPAGGIHGYPDSFRQRFPSQWE